MITLGTIAAIGFADFDPPQWLALYRRLGCRVVQAYRTQEREVSLAEMRDALAAGEMPCDSLHGVFGEQYDPSTPDETQRRWAVDAYRREGELVRQLGGNIVVVHCSTIRREGVPPEERVLRVEQFRRSIAELGAFGQTCGVTYVFENMPAYHAIGADLAELSRIVESAGAPNTGLCFDSGHANMVGDPCAALASAANVLYAHINDNDGVADSHDMITCGRIDAPRLARTFRQVGYRGTFMLEVFYRAERLAELLDQGLAERLANLLAIANGEFD
jgi:sugar phosphate isomerase/epimerase